MAIPVKLTRANQVTLPTRLLKQAGWLNQEYFVADLKGDYLVLKPMQFGSEKRVSSFEDLRRHFAKLGVTSSDVDKAVAWAREQARPGKSRRQTPR